ncbi:MAG: NAD-dependent epimerase/dehydratase family protein [Burkholderiales bacterium]|nr:NAD-dependent epimerase/dehydratase family protein [Burkholderiales bacterium]
MKIVITGGLGFIGRHLATRLLAAGHELVLVDCLSPQIHGDAPDVAVPDGARFVKLDVARLPERVELIEGSDAVVHLAAETGTAQSMYRIAHYTGVNCGGTAALLEAIARCERRPRQVIVASSRSIYGEGAYVHPDAPGQILQPPPRRRDALAAADWEPRDAAGVPLRAVATPETLPFAPGSVYAATKAAQELLVNSAADALGFRATSFRPQNVFGEGQSLRNPYTGIISIFFNRARQGLSIPIYEDGLETRDFVHVSDVAAAMEAALTADLPSGVAINLGAGQATTIRALAAALLQAAGLSVPVDVTGQYRVGDIRHGFADLAVARRLLGYAPQVPLDEGLRRFCTWAAGEPVHADRSNEAAAELRDNGLTN